MNWIQEVQKIVEDHGYVFVSALLHTTYVEVSFIMTDGSAAPVSLRQPILTSPPDDIALKTLYDRITELGRV